MLKTSNEGMHSRLLNRFQLLSIKIYLNSCCHIFLTIVFLPCVANCIMLHNKETLYLHNHDLTFIFNSNFATSFLLIYYY